MSTSLLIDTSTDRTIVAIIENGKLLFEAHHEDPLAHAEVLPRLVEKALLVKSNFDSVIVGMGPGPFTGLRAGIAFAESFAFAMGIEIVGVCSLDAIAANHKAADFILAVDARRKEVFYARYTNGVRVGAPNVCQPIQLESFELPILSGFPDPIALEQIAKTGERFSSPIYIRRPDAHPLPKGVKFRPLTQLDLVEIFVIEKAAYGKDAWSMAQLKEESAGKDRFYVVAEVAGKVIGYAGIAKLGEIADVLTLTVSEQSRRKGIGREMLRRVIDWARTKKFDAVMLEVRVGNEEAMPLYQSFGFLEISRRPNYYGPAKHAIVMRKGFNK